MEIIVKTLFNTAECVLKLFIFIYLFAEIYLCLYSTSGYYRRKGTTAALPKRIPATTAGTKGRK